MVYSKQIVWLKLHYFTGFVRRIVAKSVEYSLPLWFVFDQ